MHIIRMTLSTKLTKFEGTGDMGEQFIGYRPPACKIAIVVMLSNILSNIRDHVFTSEDEDIKIFDLF